MKKICLLLVLIFILLSITGVNAAEIDQKNDEVLNTLVSIGLIDSDFDLSGSISRADYAVILSKILSFDENDYKNQTFFYDATDESAESVAIRKAAAYGLFRSFNGSTAFRGTDTITIEEVCAVMVRLLGYEGKVAQEGDMNKYVAEATKLGLFKGVNGNMALNEKIAVILYNSLTANVAEVMSFTENIQQIQVSGETTLLNAYLQIEVIEGRVNAIDEIALSDEYRTGDGIVNIGNQTIKYKDEHKKSLIEYLGCEIKAYCKLDDNNEYELKYFDETVKNKSLSIEFKDFEGIRDNELFYRDGNRLRTVNLSSYMLINYNNRPTNTFPELNGHGYIRLISTDSSKYDVMIVKSYNSYVVQKYLSSNDRIILSSSEPMFDLSDYDETLLYDSDGKFLDVKNLSQFDIISVAESLDGECIELLRSRKSIYGKVDVFSENDGEFQLTIDGTEYVVAPIVNNRAIKESNIKKLLGTSSMFYIDAFGRIAGYDVVSVYDYKIGYLIDAAQKSIGNPIVKIFDQDGKFLITEIKLKSGKVKVNDNYITYSSFASGLSEDGQLIAFKTNSENQITEFQLALSEPRNGLFLITNITSDKRFRSGVNSFQNTAVLSNDSVIFIVPKEDISDESKYRVVSNSYFVADRRYQGLSFYGTNETDIAARFVVYKISANPDLTTIDSPVIVTKLRKVLNGRDEFVDKLSGIHYSNENFEVLGEEGVELSNAKYTAVQTELSSTTKVKTGDIVRCYYNDWDGSASQIELIYVAEDKKWLPSSDSIVWNDYEVIRCGKAEKIDGDFMVFLSRDGVSRYYYNVSATKFYIYDTDSHEVVKTTINDIKTIQSYLQDASDLVFYDSYDRIRWIMIYN